MTARTCLLTICVVICALFVPATNAAAAQTAAVRVKYFTLDKSEAAKGEQVVARWSFTGNARRLSIMPTTWRMVDAATFTGCGG